MSKNQEYIDQYKEFAIQQMKRYGIPASVTLAQGILESSNGKSQLAQNENNHFGIKATKAWLAAGGGYGVYTDDRPNESAPIRMCVKYLFSKRLGKRSL